MRRYGFTLIEVMTAVTIIGILSSIAVSKYHSFRAKAVMSEVTVQFATFERLAGVYMSINQSTASSIQEMGMDLPKSSFFDYKSFNNNGASTEPPAPAPKGNGKDKNQDNGQTKQTICHNGHSITVANPAIYNAHLDHGDEIGECQGSAGEDLVLEAKLQKSLSETCAAGSTLQSMVNPQGSARVEVSGSCSAYMANGGGF